MIFRALHLDTQTSIIMICFVYLILHGAIWLALKEYRSNQVKLWCVAGIVSGMSVVLLAMRGQISDFLFFYVAQLLMLVGNWGRMVALRMYFLPESQLRVYRVYNLFNIGYFIIFICLIYFFNENFFFLRLPEKDKYVLSYLTTCTNIFSKNYKCFW